MCWLLKNDTMKGTTETNKKIAWLPDEKDIKLKFKFCCYFVFV